MEKWRGLNGRKMRENGNRRNREKEGKGRVRCGLVSLPAWSFVLLTVTTTSPFCRFSSRSVITRIGGLYFRPLWKSFCRYRV